MHPITILILTFSSVSQNFVFSQTQPAAAYWRSDGSYAIKIQNDTFSSNPIGIHETISYGAMWIDGSGFNTGEHAWKIRLREKNNGASVGVSNNELFGRSFDCIGVVYNGNLSTCSGYTLVQNFGPGIHDDSVIYLLISFTESKGRLRIYYFQDGWSLGLAYDIPADAIPNLYPVVRFSGVGSASIYKIPIHYPFSKKRNYKPYEGINGPWKLDVQNYIINEIMSRQQISKNEFDVLPQQIPKNEFDFLPQPYLEIKSFSFGMNVKYLHISLKVVNQLEFNATKTKDSWKGPHYYGHGFGTNIKNFGRVPISEELLVQRILKPETVSINSKGQLEIVQKPFKLIWDRYDDSPPPFVGNPFE